MTKRIETAVSENSIFNYNNVFFSLFYENERYCHDRCPEFGLNYVMSGEMILDDGETPVKIGKGEWVFVPRNVRLAMYKQPAGGERYQGVFMTFTRQFLRHMYEQTGAAQRVRNNIPRLDSRPIKLQCTPELNSLFLSLEPYLNQEAEPSDDIMNLKLQEALFALLHIDPRFYPTLFDFSAPWKIDILDYLNANYMCDMSLEDMAHYTGRSLAAFKRDFKQVSDLTPEKWLVRKRLQEAMELIMAGETKILDISNSVGFKNPSHFSVAFKRMYGVSPVEYINRKENDN